jgi:hypothetical protein
VHEIANDLRGARGAAIASRGVFEIAGRPGPAKKSISTWTAAELAFEGEAESRVGFVADRRGYPRKIGVPALQPEFNRLRALKTLRTLVQDLLRKGFGWRRLLASQNSRFLQAHIRGSSGSPRLEGDDEERVSAELTSRSTERVAVGDAILTSYTWRLRLAIRLDATYAAY